MNFGWLVASIAVPPYLFFNKIPLHERSLLFFTSHNQPSSLALSEGDTPDRLLFQATHPKEHVQTELWSLFWIRRISSIANFTASSWNAILAIPKQNKNIFGKTFQKLFFKLSRPPRSLQKDSLNIHVLQSLLALSEGDSPDRSLLIRRHTQHKSTYRIPWTMFMNLFSVNYIKALCSWKIIETVCAVLFY